MLAIHELCDVLAIHELLAELFINAFLYDTSMISVNVFVNGPHMGKSWMSSIISLFSYALRIATEQQKELITHFRIVK